MLILPMYYDRNEMSFNLGNTNKLCSSNEMNIKMLLVLNERVQSALSISTEKRRAVEQKRKITSPCISASTRSSNGLEGENEKKSIALFLGCWWVPGTAKCLNLHYITTSNTYR